MVAGRGGAVLQPAKKVQMRTRTARVGGRACTLGARTPLGLLLGTRLKPRLRDYGSCGRAAADSSSLYVVAVAGQAERGRGGWVYKVGRRVPGTGAGDPSSRVRAGARLLWFWCEQDIRGGCQRTLQVQPERRKATPGQSLRVTVRGFDDNGRGTLVEGATVRLGASTAITGPDGVATVTVPVRGGRVTAERDGMIRSFPVGVTAS
jgi:hypothetical protein